MLCVVLRSLATTPLRACSAIQNVYLTCVRLKCIRYTDQVQTQIQILYFGNGQIQIRASLYFKYRYVFEPVPVS